MIAKITDKKIAASKRRVVTSRTPAVIAKQADAVAFKVAGESYEAIARILGYANESGARAAVKAGLAARLDDAGTEELRQIEADRLEALQRGAWARATGSHIVLDNNGDAVDVGPELKAIGTVLSIMERRAKLLGLDAPVRFEGTLIKAYATVNTPDDLYRETTESDPAS